MREDTRQDTTVEMLSGGRCFTFFMEHFTVKLWFTAEFGAMVSILMNVNECSGSSAF